jgi:hypothetical protein
MITTLSSLDKRVLDRAASLLDTTARRSLHGEVSIRCLLAVERLALAGAEPTAQQPGDGADRSDRVLIGHALQLLGALPADLLDDESVLDAMQHALLAHAATR